MKKFTLSLLIISLLPLSVFAQYQNSFTFTDSTGVEYFLGIDEFTYSIGASFDFCFSITNGSEDSLNLVFGYCNYLYDMWLTDSQIGDTVWTWSEGMGFMPMILEVIIPPDSTWSLEDSAVFVGYFSGEPVPPGVYDLLGRWMYGYFPLSSPELCLPVVIEESGIEGANPNILDKFILEQNYPNPFNSETNVSFSLNKEAFIKLEVYDISGRIIVELAKGYYEAGNYNLKFIAFNIPSGMYFYRLEAGSEVISRKMLLIK